jgi:hypothetical protein
VQPVREQIVNGEKESEKNNEEIRKGKGKRN